MGEPFAIEVAVKLVVIVVAIVAWFSSACGSIERAPSPTEDAPRGPGFGSWTFGMSEDEVRRAADGDFGERGDERLLFAGDDARQRRIGFGFDEQHRLARIMVWLAQDETDRGRVVATWSRLFDYLDRRGNGVTMPNVELDASVRMDGRMFRTIFERIVDDIWGIVAKPSNGQPFEWTQLMHPRAEVDGLALEGRMTVSSETGGSVVLIVEPAAPRETRALTRSAAP